MEKSFNQSLISLYLPYPPSLPTPVHYIFKGTAAKNQSLISLYLPYPPLLSPTPVHYIFKGTAVKNQGFPLMKYILKMS